MSRCIFKGVEFLLSFAIQEDSSLKDNLCARMYK